MNHMRQRRNDYDKHYQTLQEKTKHEIEYPKALVPKSEMENQLREVEYKIGASDRKNAERFDELKERANLLQEQLSEEIKQTQEVDATRMAKLDEFEE